MISYRVREIHWEAAAFHKDNWVLTGSAYRVLAVSPDPMPLVEKMNKLPYTTTIWKLDLDGPRQVYLR